MTTPVASPKPAGGTASTYVPGQGAGAGTGGSGPQVFSSSAGPADGAFSDFKVRTQRGNATPASSALTLVNSLAGMSSQDIVGLQSRLIKAGYLPNTSLTGVADSDTRKAYYEVLWDTSRYNVAGHYLSWNDVLQQAIDTREAQAARDTQNKAIAKAAKVGDPGNVTLETNPLDLEAQVQQAAHARLGRKLSVKEVSRFVQVYQHMQRADSAQQNAAALAARVTPGAVDPTTGLTGDATDGASSTLENIATPGAAADQYIDHSFGQEAAGHSAVDYFDTLEQMIGRGR